MNSKAVLSILFSIAALAAHANLVTNGSFTGSDGLPSVEGWTIQGLVEANGYYGMNSVRGGTDSGVDGRLSQVLGLTTGTAYRLSFDAFSNQGPGFDNGIEVRVGDLLVYANAGNLPTTWTAYEAEFVAGEGHRLSITLHDRLSTVALTNVSLQAVPEPASMAALALGSLAVVRRKRFGKLQPKSKKNA